MSTRTIPFASVLAVVGVVAGMEAAALAQPAMPQAPAYVPPAQPAPAPATTSPSPQQPAYVPPAPQPAQQQPAPSYPPAQPASSYPQPGQQPAPSYPPAPQQQGYPPAPQQQGYPPAPQQQGYPPAPQQQGYPPAPQQQGYPAPAEPEKSGSMFDDILSKVQIGVHLRTGGFSADRPAYDTSFSAYGIFGRFRFNPRWEAELSASVESGELGNGGVRELRPIEASALFHAFDLRGVDLYGRAGVGRSSEVYTNYSNPNPTLEYTNTHLHIGAGATYIFRQNIGVSAELRWSSIRRNSDPVNASGTQYGIAGSYHF